MNKPIEKLSLCSGDWVEVRSKEEILATLDDRGQLDKFPFMPEMFKYCGQRFRVWKRAHKTCDTVNKTGGRRMPNAVHLQELRCDGQAHDGCQAGCLFYWKEAWLKPVEPGGKPNACKSPAPVQNNPAKTAPNCTEQCVFAGTRAAGQQNESDPAYVCQITELPAATTLLMWWDVRQYWEDWISGNVGLGRMFSSFLFSAYNSLVRRSRGLGPALIWLYDRFQKMMRNGVPYPNRTGTVPSDQPTPSGTLNLQPGELVRVKSYPEILATMHDTNKNRGLYFGNEEVPFCGGTYRVKSRMGRIINEKTGKMMTFGTESIILEGVTCQARYSDKRLFCPRSIFVMWREVWLERVTETPTAQQDDKPKGNP